MSVNPYVINYFSNDGRRQMSTFIDPSSKGQFIQYLTGLSSLQNGDWYELSSSTIVDDAISRTGQLGGVVYNLPVRLSLTSQYVRSSIPSSPFPIVFSGTKKSNKTLEKMDFIGRG
ncbi:uncharacterized protein FIBRA_00562 [Fibroporia radiculosa]|uniref:Uncharacterized protein n=1 Tax=Fibroporia radiculosa TaxID=599839 RepID=J4HRT4_9APHY|nr:uncharacterized protein FIBRA_00562 [Fibroporia radiculosa]CCL98562.1 predicted protein [Fibroporia radiculosa]